MCKVWAGLRVATNCRSNGADLAWVILATMQNLSDRALKERIIGAVVLVVVAVLVVPIFLDGQSDNENVVSTPVRLPGQANQERQQQTIVLNRDRSEPVPTSRQQLPAPTATKRERVVEQTTATDAEPVAKPPPQKAPVEPKAEISQAVASTEANETSKTGMWAVQLGSFSSSENAEKLAADLRGQGYAAFLSQLERNGVALHRVRIGPQKDRDSAEDIAQQLAKGGHKGQVVPHP